MNKKIKVALVGLGFGAEFLPIYKDHPDSELVAVCQRNPQKAQDLAAVHGISKVYTDYDELLQDPDIDAVHINTPIPLHGQQSIAALKAGKHVACTVPMATSIEECQEIVELVKETGLKYMMMETVLYAREFLFMKEMYDNGDLGELQFLKASHQQDMEGWPNYWPGLPPMHYATHCVGPILGLGRHEAESVSCYGSGTIKKDLHKYHNSPFAVESCHVKFKDSDLSAHVYRSLFDTARQYRESIEVYGSKKSVEWPLIEHDPLVIHTAGRPEPEIPEEVKCPNFSDRLPKEIQKYTLKGVYDGEESNHLSFTQGDGHGGSHPHLTHQFVSMLKTGVDAYPNAIESANISCVGILAHESALLGGEKIALPKFTLKASQD